MSDRTEQLGRLAIVVVAAVAAAVVGWLLFIDYASDLTDILGILLVVGLVILALRIAGNIAASKFPGYNVAEVAVDGPISRDGDGGLLPAGALGATADELVDLIEAADEDAAVDALIVHLNTPGGEVVPSDDIRRAVAEFDGPTKAYATDVCASGGYWIASGCDEIWAREPSIVGSIGVIGSRPNAAGLAEKLGISYEQFTAGEYKDAGTPLREIEADEREYLQGIIDGLYDDFVGRVADGRELDEQAIRDTEARVYLGDEALELGLVDELGTHEDVEARLEDELGEEVSVQTFEPHRGPLQRVGFGAQAVAYAFGAGIASYLGDDSGLGFDFRA